MSPEAAADPDPEAIEVRLLLEAIHARYGYDLRGYAPESIQRRVRACLARSGAAHLGELQHRLLRDPAVFDRVLRHLTVGTSEMFRDPTALFALRTRIIPVLRTYPLIRIWHAGCSTGEEAYSMAILLQEEGLADRTQIYATDLSPYAVDEAKRGVYSARRLSRFAENYRRAGGTRDLGAYCTEAFGGVALLPSLRRNVVFFQHDLVCDQVFGEFHVVFCRNVLIYFGADLRQRALAKLSGSLCAGGFLAVGQSESLDAECPGLGLLPYDAPSRIYRHGC
jgi:chemotaxis protein methyltransferase CheR